MIDKGWPSHCEHGNALTEYCGMCEFDALYGNPPNVSTLLRFGVECEIARFRAGKISRQRLVQNLEKLGMTEDEIYSIDECRRAKENK